MLRVASPLRRLPSSYLVHRLFVTRNCVRMYAAHNSDLVAPQTPNAKTEVKNAAGLLDAKQTYYEKRVSLFEQYYERELQKLETAKEAAVALKVVLPDGTEKEGVSGVTSPLDIAGQISKSLAKKSIVAKVNGQEWDVTRPLTEDCSLELFGFDAPEGKEARRQCSTSVHQCEMLYDL